MPLDRSGSERCRGAQDVCGYCGYGLALVVSLNLNSEVSKLAIKLVLARGNVQPTTHFVPYSLWSNAMKLDLSESLHQVPECSSRPWPTVQASGNARESQLLPENEARCPALELVRARVPAKRTLLVTGENYGAVIYSSSFRWFMNLARSSPFRVLSAIEFQTASASFPDISSLVGRRLKTKS
jgi:hypothetical protein